MWQDVREDAGGENPKYFAIQVHFIKGPRMVFDAKKTNFFITQAWCIDGPGRFWRWLQHCLDGKTVAFDTLAELQQATFVRSGRMAYSDNGAGNTRTMERLGATPALLVQRICQIAYRPKDGHPHFDTITTHESSTGQKEERGSLDLSDMASWSSERLQEVIKKRNLNPTGDIDALRARVQSDTDGGNDNDGIDRTDYVWTDEIRVTEVDETWMLDITIAREYLSSDRPATGRSSRKRKDPPVHSSSESSDGTRTPGASDSDECGEDCNLVSALMSKHPVGVPPLTLRVYECKVTAAKMLRFQHRDLSLTEKDATVAEDGITCEDMLRRIEFTLENMNHRLDHKGQNPLFGRTGRPGTQFEEAKGGHLQPINSTRQIRDLVETTAYTNHGTGHTHPSATDELLQEGFDLHGLSDEALRGLCSDRDIDITGENLRSGVLRLLSCWIVENQFEPGELVLDVAVVLERTPKVKSVRALFTKPVSVTQEKESKTPTRISVKLRGAVEADGDSRVAKTRVLSRLMIPCSEETRAGKVITMVRQHCREHAALSKETNYHSGRVYFAESGSQRGMTKFWQSSQIGGEGWKTSRGADGVLEWVVTMAIAGGKPPHGETGVREWQEAKNGDNLGSDVEEEPSSQTFDDESMSPKKRDPASSRERSARSKATVGEAQAYVRTLYTNPDTNNVWFNSMNGGHYQIVVAHFASASGKHEMTNVGEGQFPPLNMIPWSETGIQASCGNVGPPARGEYPPKNVAGDPPPIIVKEDADASGHGSIATAIRGLTQHLVVPSASRAETSSLSNLDHKAAQRLAVIGLGDQMREDASSSINSAKDANDTDATKSATKKMKKVRKAIRSLTAGMSDEAMAQMIGDWVQASCPRPSSSPDPSKNKPELSKFLKTWATQGSAATVPVPDKLIHASGCQCDQCEVLSSDSD